MPAAGSFRAVLALATKLSGMTRAGRNSVEAGLSIQTNDPIKGIGRAWMLTMIDLDDRHGLTVTIATMTSVLLAAWRLAEGGRRRAG